MARCQYKGCNLIATKKVTIAELEVTEGKGIGEGLFCEGHCHEVIDSSADTIEDVEPEFTENVVGTVEVPVKITEEDIENIIVTAFECESIDYWAGVNNTGDDWKSKPKGVPVSTWATKLILDGKEVQLYDIEKDDNELEESKDEENVVDKGRWTLTLDKILKGIKQNNVDREFANDKDNWDSNDVDCIIQYALFGKIVFS